MDDLYYDAKPDISANGGSIPPNGAYSADSKTSTFSPNGRDLSPNSQMANGGRTGGSQTPVVRRKLKSWVGFSNLPNQVHRRSMR